ncbi:MAG: N-acetylmuramoyl-L-alanine amidase [Spirochaetes bacterium]|nr:N-acetylmuramoyl-L-alanine amidase [Spirochaetota bacterium]
MLNFKQTISVLFIILFLLSFIKEINEIRYSSNEIPVYRVVIDPGHGGLSLLPRSRHGDRYDSISEKYLSNYYAGAKYRGIEERIFVYSIAEKVTDILNLTLTEKNFNSFKTVLKKFSTDEPDRIIIKTFLSRGKSIEKSCSRDCEDPNAEFRLYDYVDKYRKRKEGRISFINKLNPHLLVSLHCDLQAPVYYRGMNPVIVAPYSLMARGLDYLKGSEKGRDFFFKSLYRDWFPESVRRTGFKWFLKDTSVYFSGYPVGNNLKIQKNRFSGYRYNMVNWRYKDPEKWEITAVKHPQNTRYSDDIRRFNPEGDFWDREKSVYESYRRDGGIEGFGGDNLYACSEIIRYILFSLYLSGDDHKKQKPGKPYISVWSLPILVNAVTAYIELGYLKNKRDRYLFIKKQDEIAEGIAAGIYSLFSGLKPVEKNFQYLPKGKKLDLDKYDLNDGKSYFNIVSSIPE